jgi:hypothetical protein
MRVLFVGGMQLKNNAARYYDTAMKLMNGFVRTNNVLLYFSDRDMARFSNIFKSRKMGIKKCNKELIKRIPAFAPDVIVFNHADVILPETLEEIRSKWAHIRMVQVNIDPIFNPDNAERFRNKSGLVDANFITTYGPSLNKLKQNDKPVYYMPNIVDGSIEEHRVFEKTDLENDLFFAYGHAPAGDPRYDIPQNILKELPEIRFKLCIASEGNGLWGNEYYKTVGQSKCGLNLTRKQEKDRMGEKDDLYLYSSDRIALLVGNGLLTFTDKEFSLDRLFSEEEMVFYGDEAELHEKLRFYTNPKNDAERIKIAKNGWEKGHNAYNEKRVASFIMDKAFETAHRYEYDWPTKGI